MQMHNRAKSKIENTFKNFIDKTSTTARKMVQPQNMFASQKKREIPGASFALSSFYRDVYLWRMIGSLFWTSIVSASFLLVWFGFDILKNPGNENQFFVRACFQTLDSTLFLPQNLVAISDGFCCSFSRFGLYESHSIWGEESVSQTVFLEELCQCSKCTPPYLSHFLQCDHNTLYL